MTVEEIINRGVLMSYANAPDSLAIKSPELITVVNREALAVVQSGIKENPWYYATVNSLSYTANQAGWVLPEHEVLLRVELETATDPATTGAAGDAVIVMQMGHRLQTNDDLPKVFHVRGVLKSTGYGLSATIDDTETLRVFYVAPMATLSSLNQEVDSYLIPIRFQDVLSYRVAVYLAAKDGRDDDQARFTAEGDRVMSRYVAWLGTKNAFDQLLWVPGARAPGQGIGAA